MSKYQWIVLSLSTVFTAVLTGFNWARLVRIEKMLKRGTNDAATQMRTVCIEKVREVLKPYELEFRRKTNSATNMVDYTAMELESLTLDTVNQKGEP